MEGDGFTIDDDEDDDMADLFSFGADMDTEINPPSTSYVSTSTGSDGISGINEEEMINVAGRNRSDSNNSNDSFLNMLESEDMNFGESFLDNLDSKTSTDSVNTDNINNDKKSSPPSDDKASQEMLNWLDEDDSERDKQRQQQQQQQIEETREELEGTSIEQGHLNVNTQQQGQSQQDNLKHDNDDQSTLAPPLTQSSSAQTPPLSSSINTSPKYNSLKDALESTTSSKAELCELFIDEKSNVDDSLRPELWCRIVCGKTLQETSESSLADSFQQWYEHYQDKSENARPSSLLERHQQHRQQTLKQWIEKQSTILSKRLVSAKNATVSDATLEEASEAISALLHYNYQKKDAHQLYAIDPLLPPVICTILSSGVSIATGSVLLSYIQPSFMPFLALRDDERLEAAKILHTQFYLLACYHFPLLVYHLDKHLPGWLWPKRRKKKKKAAVSEENDQTTNLNLDDEEESITEKARHLDEQGVIPQSWLITHLAGECNEDDSKIQMDAKRLLALWDVILCNNNNSLRFFLVLAILEKHSDGLILLTGEQLVKELDKMFQFGNYDLIYSLITINDWVSEWLKRAETLQKATPESVVQSLRVAEDEAVINAIQNRKKIAELKAKQKLEADARAFQEAQERKAEEARLRLTRARLIVYYRKYNPDKECNIDKIMVTYKDRFEDLDAHLKYKYGVGFNPAVKPKPKPVVKKVDNDGNDGTQANQGFLAKMRIIKEDKTQKIIQRNDNDDDMPERQVDQFAVTVKACEILPSVCWSKEAAAARNAEEMRLSRLKIVGTNARNGLRKNVVPLRFFIIDSRTEAAAAEQGIFPTASCLSPDALLDPKRLAECEETYESLRCGAHICIMGEGISAIPRLYGQKLTPKLEELIKGDESRTDNCALFFFKRGFPFVSIIDGGFAAAHAWLIRDGSKNHLNVHSCLVDYKSSSLFGQMEVLYQQQQKSLGDNIGNAPVGGSAFQNLLDNSMTSLTRNAMRIENMKSSIATSVEQQQQGRRNFRSFFGSTSESEQVDESNNNRTNDKNETNEITKNNSPQKTIAQRIEEGQKPPQESNTSNSNEKSSFTSILPTRGALLFGARKQVAPDSSTTRKPNGITNLWGRQRSAAGAAAPQPVPEGGVYNRFAGFGSVLNNTMKAGASRLGEVATTAKATRKEVVNNSDQKVETGEGNSAIVKGV